MSWLFSQALVEEYLPESSLDGEQSAQLSGNPTPQAYCAPDKMTDFSRLSRFGMTYKPLTESRGEELLTLYLAAFHAPTFPQQEKVQELTEKHLECGEKWLGSFTKYSPDSCSWKTHQCSLAGDLDEFLETWPQWGLMRDGECWEQQTLAQITSETASGLWETKWPTLAASDGQRAGTITDKMTGQSLPQMVNTPAKWPTPTLQGLNGGSNSRKSAIAKGTWPTPTSMDSIIRSKESWEKAQFRPRQGKNLIKLGDIQYWPTPTAHNAKKTNAPSELNRNTPTLAAQAGGSLNPTWVEWLMGWPLGWTDLKPLATDKCRFVPQQHGSFSVNNGEICL